MKSLARRENFSAQGLGFDCLVKRVQDEKFGKKREFC
jgi:hypothetical protein